MQHFEPEENFYEKRRFIQCELFASVPTKGIALAVVVDAHGLSETQMRDFAAWTNLAETTFYCRLPIHRQTIKSEYLRPNVRCCLQVTRRLEVAQPGSIQEVSQRAVP